MTSLKDRIKKNVGNQSVQQENFAKFNKLLQDATNYPQLRDLNNQVRKIERELKQGEYIFTQDGAEEFWQVYNVRKDEYYPEYLERQTEVYAEYEQIVAETSAVEELQAIKAEVCKEEYLEWNKNKKPIREACDAKIEEQKAS